MAEKKAEKPKPTEEKVEAPLAEAKPEEAPKKGKKPEKRKKEEKGVFSKYKIEGETLKRLRLFCERCGPGFFMADHGDRYTCGHCGFTRYKRAESSG